MVLCVVDHRKCQCNLDHPHKNLVSDWFELYNRKHVKPSKTQVFTRFRWVLDYVIWTNTRKVSHYKIWNNPECRWWLGQQGWLIHFLFICLLTEFHALHVATVYVCILLIKAYLYFTISHSISHSLLCFLTFILSRLWS